MMIYDAPIESSPIGQGDIFFNVPILDLAEDGLQNIDDNGVIESLAWEEFSHAGDSVSAIVAVRPTIAIVGTQECDALRAPNITLFEIRPFREVERKAKKRANQLNGCPSSRNMLVSIKNGFTCLPTKQSGSVKRWEWIF